MAALPLDSGSTAQVDGTDSKSAADVEWATDVEPESDIDAGPDQMADDPLLPYEFRLMSHRVAVLPSVPKTIDGKQQSIAPFLLPHTLHRHKSELRFALEYNPTGDAHGMLASLSDSGELKIVKDLVDLPVVAATPTNGLPPGLYPQALRVVCLASRADGGWVLIAHGRGDSATSVPHLVRVELSADASVVSELPVNAPPDVPASLAATWGKKGVPVKPGEPWTDIGSYGAYCQWLPDDQSFLFRSERFAAWLALRIDNTAATKWVEWQFDGGGLQAAELDSNSQPITAWPLYSHFRNPWFGQNPVEWGSPWIRDKDRLQTAAGQLVELNVWSDSKGEAAAWGITARSTASGPVQVLTLSRVAVALDSSYCACEPPDLVAGPRDFATQKVPSAFHIGLIGLPEEATLAIAEFQRGAIVARSLQSGSPLASMARSTVPYPSGSPEVTCTAEPDGITCATVKIKGLSPGIWWQQAQPKDYSGILAVTRWRLAKAGEP
jgi:hypothetical protein